jgi:hypothetical protein
MRFRIGVPVASSSAAVALVAVILAGCSTTVGSGGPPGADSGGSVGSGGNGTSGSSGSKASGGSGNGSSSGGTAGSSGTGTGGTDMTGPAQARPVSMDGMPVYSRFLRLTNDQWENSVHDILKLTAPTGLSEDFLHAVTGTTDFDNNERVVIVNDTVWSDFQNAAETVAAQVTATDAALQKVVATTDAATFIKTFGRRAFRRDLTADEVTKYQALYTEGTTYSGSQSAFTKGAALVITAMLQSPNFLYRSEMGDVGTPLTGYEMAAKLSLWIRDTTPTDAMLDAAKSGTFDSADGAATQATQMLEEDGAVAVMRKFHAQLYKLDVVNTITKTGVDGYSDALIPEFKDASYAFFDYVFKQNLGVKDILTTNVGFAGPLMAPLYGASVTGSGVQQIKLTDRAGWYSQLPFLTLWAINNNPDSIHRGVRINLDTLCADPGQPQINLPPVPPLEPDQTNRERYEALTGSCGAECHGQYINPIGFAFEDFDGLGRHRDMDNGKPVDTTGTYPFAEGTKDFNGAPELMQLIANGAQAHECYAKKIASYGLQRDMLDVERPLIESLGAVSLSTGASIKQVMVALVKTDAFRSHFGGAQ